MAQQGRRTGEHRPGRNGRVCVPSLRGRDYGSGQGENAAGWPLAGCEATDEEPQKRGLLAEHPVFPVHPFSDIAREFMRSKDDPELLHNFTNSWLAEPWEDTKLKTNAELVMERQTETPEWTLPPWTKLITGGIDVQENCLYWTIRAWGDYMTSQNVAHGQALSMAEVEKAMNVEFSLPNGDTAMVNLALMDSGDQTDEVYEFCAINSDWVLPCKGTSTMLSHYRLSVVNKAGSKANGMTLVLVDGGKYKDQIAARMRKPNGTGSWQVYKDCDMEYAEQVTAEHKVTERSGGKEVQNGC